MKPLPVLSRRGFRAAVRAELHWARHYLLPWLAGRGQGEASSEPARAKRPALIPMFVERR